jgi:hypothetical protein
MRGDLDTVKRLYQDYNIIKSSAFSAFINLFDPIIDPHYHEDSALLNACSYQQHDIAEYLLNQDSFTVGLNSDSKIEICLSFIMKSGNLDLTKKMLSLIEKKHSLTSYISLGFNSACAKGHLNIVKYILEESDFNWIAYDKKTRGKEDYSLVYSGFIDSCKRGQLDIVKYIVESPGLKERIDFNKFQSKISVNNVNIIRYFIFDLGIKKEDSFISKLNVSSNIAEQMDNFFKIKEMHTEIEQDINSADYPQTTKKRMKL